MHFTCPYCGFASQVAPQYVGQAGPCANCGKPVTITHPHTARKSSTIWWIIIPIVLVLLLAGGGGFVFIKGLGGARESARSSQCNNNLKQIGLAMHMHHDTRGKLPPAYIADDNGKPLHSWRVLLLPYIQEHALFEQIRLHEPWDSPHNRQFHSRMPELYRCPSAGQDRAKGITSYMVVVDNAAKDGELGRTIFSPGKLRGERGYEGGVSFGAISDGTSNTIFVVEVAGSTTNWMNPTDLQLRDQVAINASKDGGCISCEHKGGANVAMADGSVRRLDEKLSPQILKKLLVRDNDKRGD
jgi:prepilin-type processing-associated H-X9-DG protein